MKRIALIVALIVCEACATPIPWDQVAGYAGTAAAGCWASEDCRCGVFGMDCPSNDQQINSANENSKVPSVVTTPPPEPSNNQPMEWQADGPVWQMPKADWSTWRTYGKLSFLVTGWGDLQIPTARHFLLIHGVTDGLQTNAHASYLDGRLLLSAHRWPGPALKRAEAKFSFKADEVYLVTFEWGPKACALVVEGGGEKARLALGWVAPASLSQQGVIIGSGWHKGPLGKSPQIGAVEVTY